MPHRPSPWVLAAWAVGLAGLALRLDGFGARAFWTDEAWVALATRVQGWRQFWLALSVTPIGWAALLRLVARLPGPPEATLRLLPLAFGLATLWLAWRVGRAVAGHPAGGVLACAAVAADAWSIVFARTLKPYSAETCAALAAALLAMRAADGGRGAVAALALVLVAGTLVASAQLLLAAPWFGALVLVALAERAPARAARIAGVALAVAAVDAAVYRLLVAPRLLASLDAYFAEQSLRPAGPVDAVAGVARLLGTELVLAWGPVAVAAAGVALLVAALRVRAARVALVALALLVVELGLVALRRPLPTDAIRVLLFALVLLLAHGAGALGVVAGLRRRAGLALGALVVAAVVGDVARRAPWRVADRLVPREELGPLVRIVERQRMPDDGVLLYGRSVYVWAYYQTPTPVVVPNAATTVGFVPWLRDPRVRVVTAASGDVVRDALARHPRVWLVLSRPQAGDEQRLLDALVRHGRVTFERRAARALVVRVDRAPHA